VRLVNQFLTLSSAEATATSKRCLSTQECCTVIQKVLEDLASQAHAKNIDLGFEYSGVDTVVRAGPTALREITINLVENAIRYTPPDGVVTVKVLSAEVSLRLIVEDNGLGVAPEEREKIFQRFYRLSTADAAGSGLGLAIVKELASQCAAQIKIGAPAHGGTGLLVAVEFYHPDRTRSPDACSAALLTVSSQS
jgi:two-component system sensor histidine kinase TctE